MTRFYLLLFLFSIWKTNAQNLSTIFIDTIQIVVDNKTVYESNTTFLKFFPNNIDSKLTVYNDVIYKLNINLGNVKDGKLNYLSYSPSQFYINDSLCFSSISSASNFENCSGIDSQIESLVNWDFSNVPTPQKFKIKLHYRISPYAPIDTTSYFYNYREGLWIGITRGVEKVTVNYKNDKKHGVATAYYNNGTSYHVNFNNNIADNYGLGYWENYKSKFAYPIPNIVTSSCDSVKKFSCEYFHFFRDSIFKEVNKHNDLSVYYEKKGIQHDSIEYRVRGEFMSINNDTITIRTSDLEVHDYYKKNTDTLHNFFRKIDGGFAKVPTKDISKIYYTRDKWKTFTLRTTLLAFASAAIISPLISIQKNGFNHERFRNVSLTSLGVMTLSISFGIGFSQKEYLLKPTKKSNKVWKIEYDAYE
jgi:hypothetical protein